MKDTKNLIMLAYCSTIIVVMKFALLFIPNVELVTFLLIIYTITLGFKRALVIAIVYTFVDGYLGIGTHLYIWLLIVIITSLLKPIIKENFLGWSIVSALFGLGFGLLSALPYIVLVNLNYAIVYFLSGIMFDVIHMIGNYVFMLALGRIVYNQFHRIVKREKLI